MKIFNINIIILTMSKWLDFSANMLRQSYIRGFLDISGDALYLRHDASINFYNTTATNVPNMSLKSDRFRIYNDVSFTDVSTSNLQYITGLTQNVQSSLTSLGNNTQYLTSNGSNITNLSGGLILQKDLTVEGNLIVGKVGVDVSVEQGMHSIKLDKPS
jgi:hypothetical protein